MKSGVRVKSDEVAGVLAGLARLSKMDVLVGIPQGPQREDAPISNAQLGYLQSTGAEMAFFGHPVTLPPRPFLDMGIKDTQEETTGHLKAAATLSLDGNFAAAEQQLEAAGMIASNGAKAVIGDGGRLHPLSEATMRMRQRAGIQGDKPLYAHGHLLNSITYVVRVK